MKKLIIPIAAILVCFFLAPSCKKCLSCEIKYKSVSGDTTEIHEDCAKKKKINDFEDRMKVLADSLQGNVTCISVDK